jgi:hypothetical protein
VKAQSAYGQRFAGRLLAAACGGDTSGRLALEDVDVQLQPRRIEPVAGRHAGHHRGARIRAVGELLTELEDAVSDVRNR